MKIIDMKGEEHIVDGCMACDIANGKLEPFCGLLYKSEYFHVEQDFEVPINGFIIISCMKHITKLVDLPKDAVIELILLTQKIQNILTKIGVADQFTILLEERPNYHLHMWIMPRHDWIVKQFGKINKYIREIEKYALENLRTPENIKEIEKTCKILKAELNK